MVFFLLPIAILLFAVFVKAIFFKYRSRLFVEDVKRAILEAEYEKRRGNFDLK